MTKLNIKLLFIFPFFFFLDLYKPFGYSLQVEFLFLGIIFIAFFESMWVSFIIAVISGWCHDFFTSGVPFLSIFEFSLICFFISYLHFRVLTKKDYYFIVKNIIIALALIAHIFVNSIRVGLFLPFFSIQFFVQSLLIYYLIEYILNKQAFLAFLPQDI